MRRRERSTKGARLFFIPAYPLWAIMVIVIDLLVTWALTVQGGEMRKI